MFTAPKPTTLVPLTIRKVLGFPVHIPDADVVANHQPDRFQAYLDWLSDRLTAQQFTHVVTINAEMVMLGRKDKQFAAVLREADLLTPDGAGIVLALKYHGTTIQRCPGIELSDRLIQQAAQKGWRIAVVGGKPEVLDTVLDNWRNQYPQLQVVAHHGYFDDQSDTVIARQFESLQPQFVFVGLGAPRQEYWIRQHRSLAPDAIWVGIGGSLDIWSGTKERAPKWLRENHLEWLYRLYKEPWRWRRMLVLPQFAWTVLVNGDRQS